MAAPPPIYKTTADYLTSMIQSLQAQGSALTDFSVGGVARSLMEAFSVELSVQSQVADQLQTDSYLATATGTQLDNKAADLLVTRIAAVQAAGNITISRATSGSAIAIPAGLTLKTVPAVGATPVQVITTADGAFGTSDTSISVQAQAVLGGVAGNLAASTTLIPDQPINGIQSNGGFVVGPGGFTGGVDQESDDALRARVPVVVQGRANGTAAAYLAAALGVAGVSSANVLKAGATRADGSTVPTGTVEIYYAGNASLLSSVQSAINNVAVLNANATAYTATTALLVVGCTVYAKSGTNATTLGASVASALQSAANAVPVGGTVRQGDLIQAVKGVAGVVTVNVPFSDLRLSTGTPGSAADVVLGANQAPSLTAANTSVAVNATL